MNCEKLLEELSLCIMPKSNVFLKGARRSIASCAVKFPTEVEQLNMLGSSHISYPVSLDILVPPIAIYSHPELASGDLLAADDCSTRLHSCGSFCEGGSSVDHIRFATALASEDQATAGSHCFLVTAITGFEAPDLLKCEGVDSWFQRHDINGFIIPTMHGVSIGY